MVRRINGCCAQGERHWLKPLTPYPSNHRVLLVKSYFSLFLRHLRVEQSLCSNLDEEERIMVLLDSHLEKNSVASPGLLIKLFIFSCAHAFILK